MEKVPGKHYDLNEIFAFVYALKILDDYSTFKRYLASFKTIPQKNVFNGFLFLIKTIQRRLMQGIASSWSLHIEEDITLHRAMNRGVHISRIKNTCQKTIFLKNLHLIFRKCWKSKNEDELQLNLKAVEEKFMKPMERILENNVQLTEKFQKYTKRKIVEALAMFYTFIFLNDTHRGFPHGYFCSLLRNNIRKKYLSDVFEGYKLGLQFLWKNLLGDTFDETSLAHINSAKNWKELDAFFREIQKEIIEPFENKLKCDFAFDEFFTIARSISASSEFGDLILNQPREMMLSQEEDLQQALLWYPVQALTHSGSYVFNGVPAFVSTLVGSVELKRRLGIEEKAFIMRFVHPEKGVKGNNYSYGVLVEAFGTIADYSGWLIFFDCCTDYSGFGGSEHAFAEFFIDRYEKDGRIKVIEYNIDKETLAKYLAVFSIEMEEFPHPFINKIPSGDDVKKEMKILQQFSLDSKLTRLEDDLGTSRGYLLELLAYWYYTSKGYTTKWRYKDSELGEIDILAKDANGVLNVTSCMASFNPEKIKKLEVCVKRMQQNEKVLPKEFRKYKEIRKVILTSKDIRPELRNKVHQKGITTLSLDRLFREDPIFSRIKKRELEKILGTRRKINLSRLIFS